MSPNNLNTPQSPTTHCLNDGVFYFVKCVFSYVQVSHETFHNTKKDNQ